MSKERGDGFTLVTPTYQETINRANYKEQCWHAIQDREEIQDLLKLYTNSVFHKKNELTTLQMLLGCFYQNNIHQKVGIKYIMEYNLPAIYCQHNYHKCPR